MKHFLFRFAVIAAALILVCTGCENLTDPEIDTQISFVDFSANGSITETTTKLTLAFCSDIANFTADDITLTCDGTGAVKGTLTKMPETGMYELSVSGKSRSGQVAVTINKTGYTVTPASRDVGVFYAVPVSFSNLEADGSTIETTTKLTLTLDKDISNFSMEDITLLAGHTGAVKKALTKLPGTGKYELAISGLTAGGHVSVMINKDGYEVSPAERNVSVFFGIPVSFISLKADGSITETTTKLTFHFDKDIYGLTADDITLISGNTGAAKGTLTKLANIGMYELPVDGINANGEVTVEVSKDGYTVIPDSLDVSVFYAVPVSFINLSANGSLIETTTTLTLTFDKDIADLTAGDITLTSGSTGAVRGALTRTGTGVYELVVNSITKNGQAAIAVNKSGYDISSDRRDVNVYYAVPVSFTNLTADGSLTVTTTKLTLTFDKDIEGFNVDDITLSCDGTGAAKGNLTRTGTGVYELAVHDKSAGGQITIAVYKAGFNVSPVSRNVPVFFGIPAAFSGLEADGSTTESTTKLTLKFDKDINGLSAGDITLNSGSTGAVKGSLTKMAETGVYELAVSGLTASGQVTISVSKDGYTVLPGSLNVNVFSIEQVSFNNLTTDGSVAAMSSKLILTFSKNITGLTAADITLNSGDTGAVKGALTNTNTGVYELALSGINKTGSVSVTVAQKAGYNIVPAGKEGMVYFYEIPVEFISLTSNGGNFVTTNMVTLTFSQDIPGLSLADITLQGSYSYAQKGFGLYARGNGVYDMEIMGISNAVPNDVMRVTVNKYGYSFSPASRNVSYYYARTISFSSVTANGSSTQTTTMLTLHFHNPDFSDVQGLNFSHITLSGSTGATRGSLSHMGGTGGLNNLAIYNLYVNNVNQTGSLGITIANIPVYDNMGFVVSNRTRNVQVYYYPEPVNFNSVTANGSVYSTTTKLTFNFSKDITGLNVNDITLTTTTGAINGGLTRTGTGIYELDVSGISASGQVGAAVSKYGFAFNPVSRNVNVHYAEPVSFNGVSADGGDFLTTSLLTLNFDKDITGLTAADISLTPNSTGAVKGGLNRIGTGKYELAVSGIVQSGSIGVTVAAKSGYDISPLTQNVTVHYAEPVVLNGLTANGSISSTTTKLILNFDKDIADLSANDITLNSGNTGTVKGALARTGTGLYELAVSGITTSGTVNISVSKIGYNITGINTVNVIFATHGTTGSIAINLWVNEVDGQILSSGNDISISKGGSNRSFTAAVNSGFTGIQWTILGYPVRANEDGSVTINAADYNNGTYRLNVIVFSNGVPYSTTIRFTVTN